MEYIVATANKENEAKELGQGSLFAGMENEIGFSAANFALQGSDEEFDDKQIQMFEKEFLGFYVTSHPLSSIRKHLPFLMTHKVSDLKELPNDKMVTVCGLITSVKQIPTKKDPSKFIRFLTIEDLTGRVEIVCFHKKLLEYGEFLNAEQKVIISGKISRREEDSLSLMLESAKPVDNSNIVTIELLDEFKYEQLVALKDVMYNYHGSDPVIFKVMNDEEPVKIITSSIFWVKTSNELINSLEKNFTDKIKVNIKSLD